MTASVGETDFPAVIYMPADSFDLETRQVMGRRVAGRLLTGAFVSQLHQGERLTVVSPGRDGLQATQAVLQPLVATGAKVQLSLQLHAQRLMQVGALHLPDPLLAQWCWLRQGLAPHAFSFTGVIHTLCSEAVVRGLLDLPLAPLYPWDAVVCTSAAGRKAVLAVLEHRLETMAIRLGGERSPAVGLPQLPVIPLAGSTRQPFRPDLGRGQRRQLARQQLGIDADVFVVAFVGRLSFHSKAHPQVLYQALQAFAESADVSVTLVECGHHFNSEIAEAYRDLQRHFPRVQFMLVGGLTPASEGQKWQVLAAADVFSSPADNLQETFGLSLLEAMAAELPLVVSDWDGYRDLVDHGHNGLLVPTSDVLPRFTQADDLDHAYATQQIDYDLMVGLRSCGVVIDRHALTAAFAQLHADPRSRQQMGKAGLEVLEQRFSEAAVTDLYRALWADLAERRALAGEQPQNVGELPALQPSQAKIFGHYATTTLDCTKVRADAASLAAGLVLNSMNRGLMQQLVGAKLDEVIRELREAGQLDLKQLQNLGLSPQRGRRVLAALLKLGLAEKAE